MKNKSLSNNINYVPYSQPLNNISSNNKSNNRNTINTSKNYFRLYKEYEANPNIINSNITTKKNSKIINSLNEKIYSDNSKKLGEYYIKNKEDLILYGSKKYDLLTIDKLVQEMKQYKNSILKKINQNPNKFKLKNYGLQNSNQNLILTPLAQKERSKMGSNEKELFNLAERRGVVMRRIEYTNSLSGGGGLGLDMKIFFIMKDAVKMIEKFWILHKEGKNRKIKKFVELLDKYIKRKVLRLMNFLNNERLKNIYMNQNSSSISFKNNLFNDENSINDNKLKTGLNQRYSNNIEKKMEICYIDEIQFNGNNNDKKEKNEKDDIQKKYYKLILDYKMIQEELNKYKNENSNMKNKINTLINENKEINSLREEKNELINKFDELSKNYNNLLKDFDALNDNNSNLLSNQSIIFNNMKNNIQIKETEEYRSLLNEYNTLKEENNQLNEILMKTKDEKTDYIPVNEETINEINEYKNKIEELNKELSNQQNDYEQKIKVLNESASANISQIQILENKIKNYENKIKEKEEELNDYKNKFKNQEKELNYFKNKVKNQEKELDNYKNKDKEVNSYKYKIKNLEKELNDYKNRENELNNYKVKIQNLEKELNDYKNRNIELKDYKNRENELNDYQNKIKKLEKELNDCKNLEKELIEYKNKIKNLEKKIKDSEAKVNIYEYQIKEYKTKEVEFKNKIHIYEQKISINNTINSDINLIRYKEDLNNLNIRLNEKEKKINIYITKNNELNNENNKNKITIRKLNNLIMELNTRLKQLLEENKNIRTYSNKYINSKEKLLIIFLDKIFNKALLKYKFVLMINLMQENINNFTKYIIYQNSLQSSLNIDGYEKVITGESKKIITKENDANKISYDNKIIIHKELDNTLKDYIIKGKNNLTFDEIFEDEKSNNINNNEK